jgi:hypothetical protein
LAQGCSVERPCALASAAHSMACRAPTWPGFPFRRESKGRHGSLDPELTLEDERGEHPVSGCSPWTYKADSSSFFRSFE